MKVSLIQMESNGTLKENINKSFKLLYKAINDKPDIICLSELFLSWGKKFDNIRLELDDLNEYFNFARENNVNLILGSVALKSKNKMMTNTCIVIGRKGSIIGQYSKKYMYKYNGIDFNVNEEDDTISGNKYGIFDIDGIKVGVGICFDLRYPECFRELVRKGAKVIFLPSHFRENTGNCAWNILPEARAIENQVYFCACNQTGNGVIGESKIISYDGSLISKLSKEEDIISANLDIKLLDNYRKTFPVLEQM